MYCFHEPINQWPLIERKPYRIIVADTSCRRVQGLQGAIHLPPKTLMLFPDITPGTYFHTKNCLFDMDIVPLSSSGEVLNIYTVKPNSLKIGPMPIATRKVLEAPAGWFKQRGIRVGDFVPLLNL